MKKLIASVCCIIAFQNFSQVAIANDDLENISGRRMLVKALAVIVNSDAANKVPPKRIAIPNVESPRI